MTKEVQPISAKQESVKLQTIYLPILLLALLTLVIFAGIVPGLSKISETRSLLVQRRQTNSALIAKTNLLANIDDVEVSDRLQTALQALPIEPPFQKSLFAIIYLADKHSLNLEELEFMIQNVPSKKNLPIQVKLIVAGPLPELYSLFGDLEQAMPLVSLKSIDLSVKQGSPDESDKNKYLAEINIDINFMFPPKDIGRPSSSLPVITSDQEKALKTVQGFGTFTIKPGDSSSGGGTIEKLFPD